MSKYIVIITSILMFSISSYARDVKYPVKLSVPSDSQAKYEVLALEAKKNSVLYVTTKRHSPYGISYSQRRVDCKNGTYSYTKDGDSYEEFLESNIKYQMSPLVIGSISYYVSGFSCKKIGERLRVNN